MVSTSRDKVYCILVCVKVFSDTFSCNTSLSFFIKIDSGVVTALPSYTAYSNTLFSYQLSSFSALLFTTTIFTASLLATAIKS